MKNIQQSSILPEYGAGPRAWLIAMHREGGYRYFVQRSISLDDVTAVVKYYNNLPFSIGHQAPWADRILQRLPPRLKLQMAAAGCAIMRELRTVRGRPLKPNPVDQQPQPSKKLLRIRAIIQYHRLKTGKTPSIVDIARVFKQSHADVMRRLLAADKSGYLVDLISGRIPSGDRRSIAEPPSKPVPGFRQEIRVSIFGEGDRSWMTLVEDEYLIIRADDLTGAYYYAGSRGRVAVTSLLYQDAVKRDPMFARKLVNQSYRIVRETSAPNAQWCTVRRRCQTTVPKELHE